MPYSFVRLDKLTGPKKYAAVLMNTATKREKTVKFGASSYEDFTIHRDEARKAAYIARHRPREVWSKEGVDTAGFWSRWLLWNLPTITASLADIKKRFF